MRRIREHARFALALWLALGFAVAALAPTVTAAPEEEAADPSQRLADAEHRYRSEGPEAALPVYQELAQDFKLAGQVASEAVATGYIGEIFWRLGDYPRAGQYLQEALAMKRAAGDRLEQGRTLNVLGLLHWDLGEFEQAKDYFREGSAIAADLDNRRLQGAILNNLSLVYDELGDYYVSLEQYQQVLDLYRDLDFPRGEGDTLGNIGGVYLLLGRYPEALDHYRRALAISEQLDSPISMSQDHGNVALCYLGMGQVDNALTHLQQAIDLSIQSGMKQDEAFWLRARGNARMLLGRYDLALEDHRAALALYEQLGSSTESIEALHDTGRLYLLLGDSESARGHFERAIGEAREIGLSRAVTQNLLALGDLERRQGQLEASAALYIESVQRAKKSGEWISRGEGLLRLSAVHREQARFQEALAESIEALDLAHRAGAAGLAVKALYAQAESHRLQGQLEAARAGFGKALSLLHGAPDPELEWQSLHGQGLTFAGMGDQESAITALRASVAVIEGVRDRLREDRFRSGFVQDKYQVYIDLVRLQLESGLDEEAFSTAERLRSRSYLDLIDPGAVSGDEEDQLRESMLQARIHTLRQALAEERDRDRPEQRQSAIAVFSQELLTAEREYQVYLDDGRRKVMPATALRVPHYREVAAALVEDEALVEYVVGRERLMLFLITHDRLVTRTVALRREDLDNKVALLSGLIRQRSSDGWKKPASSLARFLVEPLRFGEQLADIHHLYLVPHGSLNYLPFSLLPSHSAEDSHRLIEDFTLAYLPTAAVLSRQRPEPRSASSMLAIAPDVSHLRFAQEEARTVNALFQPDSIALVGRAATESAFKQLAPDYRMMHLATHGFFNKLSPLLSGVQLEADTTDDGRLELHEILELKLDADLVTLSACETGLGSGYFAEVPAGDDYVGLTRAFMSAGSAMVLATLWEVDDASTLRLMEQFYGDLAQAANGEDKTAALTRAQRTLLSSEDYSHPYYWAPFVLVGSAYGTRRQGGAAQGETI